MKLKNETVVISENGVEVTTSKTYSVKVKTDEFYMTFLDYVGPFFDLTKPTDKNLMIELCTMAEYNTGIVRLTAHDKKDIANKFNVAVHSIENSVTRLKQKNLITGDKGRYLVNPFIFWKGTTEERNKLIKQSKVSFGVSFEHNFE